MRVIIAVIVFIAGFVGALFVPGWLGDIAALFELCAAAYLITKACKWAWGKRKQSQVWDTYKMSRREKRRARRDFRRRNKRIRKEWPSPKPPLWERILDRMAKIYGPPQ